MATRDQLTHERVELILAVLEREGLLDPGEAEAASGTREIGQAAEAARAVRGGDRADEAMQEVDVDS